MGTDAAPPRPLTCSAEEQRLLIDLARHAIRAAIDTHRSPELEQEHLTPTLSTPAATFVTLNLDGKLRGCVGNLVVRDPLHRSVAINAAGAAMRDTRFSPVTLEEWSRLAVHISILSTLQPLLFGAPDELLTRITPGTDGVALRHRGRTATYLPQVWKTFRDTESFLGSLCRKAGLDVEAWRERGAEILIYRVSEFGNTDAD